MHCEELQDGCTGDSGCLCACDACTDAVIKEFDGETYEPEEEEDYA